MFTWIDMLIVAVITFLFTGFLTIIIMSLMIARGNNEREEEAYKEGFKHGRADRTNCE